MIRLVPLAIAAVVVCSGAAASPTTLLPTPIGTGPRFHPSASSRAVERGAPTGRLRCSARPVPRFGVHLELFAHGRVVIVPAGIGVAPPLRRRGAMVTSGRCSYPVRTREPTGVVEVARSARLTLADFFAVWGRAFDARRLVGFRTPIDDPVRAYVGGLPWHGEPLSIPLRRHVEIVLELGAYVPPHTSYRFPGGL